MLLFFLLLALFFWILTKFSKEYTETVSATLQYENAPENTMLVNEDRNDVTFDMVGNGFELVLLKLKNPKIKVDVGEFYIAESKLAVIPNADLVRIISSQLDRDRPVSNLSVEDLEIVLNKVVSKRVPVRASTDLTFKEGFKSLGAVKVAPDSVDISGPEGSVEGIEFVTTDTAVLRNVDKNVEVEVAINFPAGTNVSVSPDKVELSVPVEEFTQKNITVPVEVTNFNSEGTLKLIPETVSLTFDVSVNDFKNILSSDFRVVCDYAERNPEGNFMFPKLVKTPDGILNVEMGTNRIEYLIFK